VGTVCEELAELLVSRDTKSVERRTEGGRTEIGTDGQRQERTDRKWWFL